MEGHLYVSCIKINGVPILPPMITNDMKREISDYKKSAVAIEKRLATLRIAKQFNTDIRTRKTQEEPNDIHSKNVHLLKKSLDAFKVKNSNHIGIDASDVNDVSTAASECSNENTDEVLYFGKNIDMVHKFDDQRNFDPTAALATTTNVDHCTEDRTSTKSVTSETASEIWKPQVPKTLNIIPLALSNADCKENKEYYKSDVDNPESTPKLVRQGSYVLDTPSPILLAHMQMELGSSAYTSCSEYVPTSCPSATQQKDWNVERAKVEWEYEAESKESGTVESSKSLPVLKGNLNSSNDRVMCKSISLQTEVESPPAMFPYANSADCIQTMLAKEDVDRNKSHILSSTGRKERGYRMQKKYNSSTALNGTCTSGSSLEDVNKNDNISIGQNLTDVPANLKAQGFTPKLKLSLAASNKLLTVYKRVQEMHKKQMAELMSRQQKEQTLLQKEFEKQQLLLLTEIRKSFPAFSANLLPGNVIPPTVKHVTPQGYNNINESINSNKQQNISILTSTSQEDEMKSLENDDDRRIVCPLDYLYPEINGNNVPCPTKIESSDTTIEKVDAPLDNMKNYEEELLGNVECKRSNVSRELFPLDSKTIHVPIPDRTMYTVRHIKAANVINAYVRGYLVRRMMRTECVIALKNTYKEALHCMLKLHVDAPLNRSEFNFLHRLQLQCDAASMNIVELFAQNCQKRMQVIAQDREIKQSRIERPTSARSYSFATQRTLARKKLKEMEECQPTSFVRSCLSRARCQTWTSDVKEKLISSNILYYGIKRSTSAGTVRKPWR